MNKEIIKTMDEQSKQIYDDLTKLEEMYASAKSENKDAEHLNKIAECHNKLLSVYNEIKQDKKNYEILAINLATNPNLQSSMDKYTEHLAEKYLGLKKKAEKNPIATVEDANYAEEPKGKSNRGKILATLALVTAILGAFT